MDPSLAPNRNRPVKTVHQKTLAAPNAPPHPDSSWHFRGVNEADEPIGTSAFEGEQLVFELL
jgi:hypothetical protein